jgi:hypothetical protein
MPAVPDVLCDASVVMKWFHAEGEEEVDAARALLDLHRSRRVALSVLDLTAYDAAYAAAAESRGAEVATLDRALLHAGLGRRPSEILASRDEHNVPALESGSTVPRTGHETRSKALRLSEAPPGRPLTR